MTTDLERCTPAGRRWRIGPYEFEHYPSCSLRSGWCCRVPGRGVGNHRSPVAAFLALRRWLREPAVPGETP